MKITGQSSLADLFGVAEKTIVEWQDEGMPVVLRGQAPRPNEYDSVECIRWMVQREVHKVQGESPRDRVFRLQADKLELELAKERGLLIPVSIVEPRMLDAVLAAREHLMSEKARLAALVHGRSRDDVEQLLGAAFEDTLRRLADWRAETNDET
jgi:terminase small subunit / prophage DNA-packing protein